MKNKTMNETQARRFFNREARYFERGLPPNRQDLYAIALPRGGTITAPGTDILWERFWAAIHDEEVTDAQTS